jgi:Predicted membrane protein (DUF2339)
VELILVLLGLAAVSIPFATAYLLWRERDLRRKLLKLTELTMELNDGLRRELLELKHQVAAVPARSTGATAAIPEATHPATIAAKPPAEKPAAAVAPTAVVKPAENVVIPQVTVEQRLSVFAEKREADRQVIPKPETQPARPMVTPPISEAPPAPKSAPLPAPTQQPTTPPAVSPRETYHVPSPAPRPHIRQPPAPPSPPIAAPPRSARVAEPPFASFRAPAAKVLAQQRMKSVFALEEILGKNWLNKIGITLLVIGIAYFGIKGFDQLGPLGKVVVTFAISFGLLAGGAFLAKRDRYRIFSYALIGGGWALLFFTSYALNHVPAMRILGSETTDLILMLMVALAMVAHTLRYRSQVVTGLAFLLAYTTVALSHDNVYSLSSGVILAVGLVSIVIKMGWFELELFGILSSYLNHLYWLYRLLGPEGANGHVFPEYQASTAILLFYWLTYRISYVIRKPKSPFAEHISSAAALVNTLLLLGAMKFQSVRPELAFWALLLVGAIEFTLGQLPVTRRRREAFVVLSVLGAALMIAAVPFRYSGNDVAILWMIGAEAFLAAGVAAGEVVFRCLGLLAGLLVALRLFKSDFPQLIAVRQTGETLLLAAGIMFALCAVVFYLNALFVGDRWRSLFEDSFDARLLQIHSYIGGFAAVSAAWALCSGDWTVLAFVGVMLVLAVTGQHLKSDHLQLQYGVIGLLSLYRVMVFNLHREVPQYTHVSTRLITLPLVAGAFYLTAKWGQLREDSNQRIARGCFALAGTALVTALLYYEVPELWQPVAAIVFAVVLLEVARAIGYDALVWHAHSLTGLAILFAVTADPMGIRRWRYVPVHAFGALPVVSGAYWIALRVRLANQNHSRFARMAYTWAGTGLMVWALSEALPASWISVAWILFAVVLALTMRRINYSQLAWQANFVAVCSVVRAFTYDIERGAIFWGMVSQRIVTISLVAAGLYFLSRRATVPASEAQRAVAYLHTFAATTLLAFLAWYEAPSGWLAAVWALFALLLALLDRRFDFEELAWQAHALAALTMMRAVSVNLYGQETWHGISVRLLSLTIVTVVLYALSRVIRPPEEWRAREFHHLYSWAASALVALLMWYELQSLSVAVGWAVFGLVLFEYGLWRQTRQFRLQAYVALAASFGRIFFANLTAGEPGESWGPRIYTVLPIAIILFFVYAQIGAEQQAQQERRLRLDVILAYLGSATIVAVLYFQYPNDWLVTAWAMVVFILLGVALRLNRPLFLDQGLLLTLGACARGMMHNLFGASYFSGGEWTGKYGVLGSGIAVLLLSLPFAFRLRDGYKSRPAGNWIAGLSRHPEQFLFFAPVILLTVMLALEMRAGMVTVAWGIEALGILIFAFIINERSFRLTGLLLLLASFAKILAVDMWSGAWTWRDRYITLVIVGAAMVLASFLYTRYSDKIRQFL